MHFLTSVDRQNWNFLADRLEGFWGKKGKQRQADVTRSLISSSFLCPLAKSFNISASEVQFPPQYWNFPAFWHQTCTCTSNTTGWHRIKYFTLYNTQNYIRNSEKRKMKYFSDFRLPFSLLEASYESATASFSGLSNLLDFQIDRHTYIDSCGLPNTANRNVCFHPFVIFTFNKQQSVKM